jgi:SAM-dependent methyltransferase
MKETLRRIPGLVPVYRQARFLSRIAYEGWWADSPRLYDRLHRRQEWDFASPLVQERNARLIAALTAALGPGRWGEVLELGCAEGIFTAELAPRCTAVTATDVSPVACENAKRRCASMTNVIIKQLNLLRDPIPGTYDVVFAMDVFDCIHGRGRIARAASSCAAALRPGGLLAFSGCCLPASLRTYPLLRWLREGADNLVDFLHGRFGLSLLHREIHPDDGRDAPGYPAHVIALFRRDA